MTKTPNSLVPLSKLSHCLKALTCWALLALGSGAAQAQQSSTWINSSGGSWTNTANWNGGLIASGSGNTADFSTLTLSAAPTVTLDGPQTLGNLVFGDLASAYGWTLNTGAAGPLTLAVGSGTPTIQVNGQNSTINLALAGSQGLAKTGAGTLTLSAATYTGATVVNNGMLVLNGDTGFVSPVTVSAGATLGIIGNSYTLPASAAITLSNSTLIGTSTSSGRVFLNGPITVLSSATLIAANPTAYQVRPNGGLFGTNAILTITSTNAANGGFQFNGPNGNFSGSVVVSNITVNVWSPGTNLFAQATVQLAKSGGIQLGNNTYGNTIRFMSLSGGDATGTIRSDGGANTLAIGTNSGSGSFPGAIINGTGTASFIKEGTGTQVLTGANTYTGPTTINGGILEVDGSLGTSAVTVNAVLDGSGTLNGAVTIASGGLVAGGLTLAGGATVLSGGTASAGTNTTPSAVIAKLSATGGMVLNPGATNFLRIIKTGDVLASDQIGGGSRLSFAGTLVVANITSDATSLAAGDAFAVFPNWSSYAGNFTALILPALPAGLSWDLSQLTVNGSIAVAGGAGKPIFSPPAGGYIGAQSVYISSPTPSATIYYTTDGTLATTGSTLYTGAAISVPANVTMTINAIATATGYANSANASATYVTASAAVWINPAGGSWTLPGNWANGIIAAGAGATADFSQLSLPGLARVSLGGPWTLGSLIFGDQANANSWEIDAGTGGTLTLASTNTPTITVSNQTTSIFAPLGGSSGLALTGPGTLALTGATYTGPTTLSNHGTLILTNDTGFVSPILVNSGSTLGIIGNAYTLPASAGITLSNGTLIGTSTSSGRVFLNGPLTVLSSGTLIAANPTAYQVRPNGGLFGTNASLTITSTNLGNGGIQFNGPNGNFSGSVLISNILVNVWTPGTNLFAQANVQLVKSAGIQLGNNNYNNVIRFMSLVGGDGTGHVQCDNGANTLAVGTNNGSGTFDGTILNGAGSSPKVSLIKEGSGTQVLTGNNTYTGTTTVNGGTLQVDGALGNTAVTVMSGILDGAGTLGGSVTSTNGGLLTGALSVAGVTTVQSNGILAGTLTLSGATTVQGGGTVGAGTNTGASAVVGLLSANGGLSLSAGSTNFLRVTKTGGTLANDQITGSGSLSFAGTLVIANITSDGHALAAGDSFILFPGWSGYSGSFNNFVLPPLAVGLSWDLSQLLVNSSIAVANAAGKPVFSPPAGGYLGAQAVAISSTTPNATIYYTTNGTPATTSSTLYTGPIIVPVNASRTINAIATAVGYGSSPDVSASYVTANATTWLNPNAGSWGSAGNWTNGIIANGADGTADFSQLTLPAPETVTLDGAWTIGTLIFADQGNANSWEIDPGNGGGSLTLAATNTPLIMVTNQTTTITAPISGTNGLKLTGTGTLVLTSSNTFSGGTLVSQGTLVLGGASSAGTGAITLGAGDTGINNLNLTLNNLSDAAPLRVPITVVPALTGTVTILQTAQNGEINTNLVLNSPTTLSVECLAGGAYYNYSGGAISGNVGTLTLTAPSTGLVYLRGSNSFTGTVVLAQGGVDVFNASAFAGAGNSVVMSNSASLGLYNSGLLTGDLTGDSSTTINLSAAGNNLLTISSANSATFAGIISGGGGLVKAGSGTQFLPTSCDYTGPTVVSNGTLQVDGGLASGAVTVLAGALLDGVGTLSGNVIVNSGGMLAVGTNVSPGAIVGQLSLLGGLTFDPASTNFMRITKTGGVLAGDQIVGSGPLNYAGTLVVVNITSDSTALTAGDSFQLFRSWSGYGGGLNHFTLPPLPGGLSWDLSQLAVNGSIAVITGAGTPIFNPAAGGYIGAQNVTITSTTPGAAIYYTTNGNPATTGSTLYTGPITVPVGTARTINAIAAASGYTTSADASASYVTEPEAVWLSPNSGSWGQANNWTNGIIANVAGGTADFSQLTLPAPAVVTLDGSWTIGNLIFGDVGNTYPWEIDTGAGGTLTLAATNTPSITLVNQSATIAAVLAGTSGLTVNGPGALTLTGATYTGPTTVNNATLTITSDPGFVSPTLVNSGSTVAVVGNAYTLPASAALTLSNSTLIGTSTSSGRVFINGPITVLSSATFLAENPTAYQVRPNGGLYGTNVTLTITATNAGNGGFQFNGPNGNFSGNAIISNVVVNVWAPGTNLFAQAKVQLLSSAGIQMGNNNTVGTTFMSGNVIRFMSLVGGDGTGQIKSDNGANTLAVGTNNGSGVFDGTILDGAGTGPKVSLIKEGSGTQVLKGVNTYTGPTTISGGTLEVDGSLGSTAVAVIGTLDGTGTIAGPTTIQPGGTLAAGTGLNLGTLTFTGTLALNAGGTTSLRITKTGGTLGNDQISGTGPLAYNGTLMVANVTSDSHALAAGDSFPLFPAWSAYSGAFSSFVLPALPPGLVWNWTNGTLSVATSPTPPRFTHAGPLAGGSFSLTFSGTSGTAYTVMMSTNVALPVADWTALTNGTFGASPATYTDTSATNARRFYLIVSP